MRNIVRIVSGDKLRVNIELIDPKTRLPVWSTRIEREDADRSGLVDEIIGQLARELQFEPPLAAATAPATR
jgi:TolB-like protein